MNERVLKDEFRKNNLKDNLSGKFDKITFERFKGEKVLKIKPKLDGSYGYMCVSISEKSDMEICLQGVKIFDGTKTSSTIIPLRFVVGDEVSISGECEGLKILISGAEFETEINNYLLFRSKKYIENCGGISRVYAYSSLNEGKSAFVLEEEDEFEDMIEFDYSGTTYLAKIKNDDGGYICTNMDNYTHKISLDFDYDDLIVLGGSGNNLLDIVYALDTQIYVCGVDKNYTLLTPQIVSSGVDNIVDLVAIKSTSGEGGFVCKSKNGLCVVYINISNNYVPIFTTKSQKSHFCIVDDKLYYIYKKSYDMCIRKYEIDMENQKLNYLASRDILLSDSVITDGKYVIVDYNLISRIEPIWGHTKTFLNLFLK